MTTVLDGGLATELEARGHDLSDRLWSARLLLSEPDAIEEVHLAFTGARVAITASYQASVEGFAAAGLDRRRRSRRSGAASRSRSARAAVPRGRGGRGARPGPGARRGIGGAVRRDARGRFRYRGDYDPGDAALEAYHRPRIDALVAAGADLLAVETIPTVREVLVLVRLLDETGVRPGSRTPAAMALTAAGEPFAEAIAVAGPRAMLSRWASIARPRSTCARTAQDRAGIHGPSAHCLSEPGRHVGSGARTWQRQGRDVG